MNWKKISLYILFTFAFSWTVALVMTLIHLDMGTSAGKACIAMFYMPAPALVTFILQKFIYKESFTQYGWTFDRKAILHLLFAPLAFLALTLLTFAIILLLGNTHLAPVLGQVDLSQEHFVLKIREIVGTTLGSKKVHMPGIPAYLIFIVMLVEGIVAGATVNLPFTFGEELGWRGLLLWETRQLGFIKANVFIGLVWGIWHWPVILMGLNYPHHPYLGILMMILSTISMSPLFAYVRIKTRSILGSCMLHGMVNATGAMYVLFIANGNEFFSSIAGWAGIAAGVVLTICIVLFDKKFAAEYTTVA